MTEEKKTASVHPVEGEFTRDNGSIYRGPQRSSPYAISRLAPPHDLVNVAKQIAEADAMISTVTSARLEVLAKQIQSLQDEARSILEATHRSIALHRATCNFIKRPGTVYHLYRKANDELWFSMISPEDWGSNFSSSFEGSYRLEYDQSWTPMESKS